MKDNDSMTPAEYPRARTFGPGQEPAELHAWLLDELQTCIGAASGWQANVDLAEDVLHCWWAGQSDDGLKHDDSEDTATPAVFPWPGASDSRIRLAKSKTREACRIQNSAFRRAEIQLTPTELSDETSAQLRSTLLRWMIEIKMRPHFERERQRAVHLRTSLGVSYTLIGWERATGTELKTLDLPMLIQLAQADPQMAALLAQILEEGADLNPVVEALGALFPDVAPKYLKACLRDLRETGSCELPRPYVLYSRPRRRALKPFDDFFMPIGMRTVHDAQWFAVRDCASEHDLRDKILTEDWDEEAVEALLENGERSTWLTNLTKARNETERWRSRKANFGTANDLDRDGLYEYYTFYHWTTDPDTGVAALYRTVLSPFTLEEAQRKAAEDKNDDSGYAECKPLWQGIEKDAVGTFPIVEHVFYREFDEVFNNTGVPLLLDTNQHEIKAQRDARTDYHSIQIRPMFRRHIRDRGTPLTIVPGGELYEAIRGSTEMVEWPRLDMGASVELENASRHDANLITASMENGDVPANYVLLQVEELSANYLEEEAEVLTRIWQKMQQEIQEEEVLRVTGPLVRPFEISGAEIRGAFDLTIDFDAESLDRELRAEKMKLFAQIATMDRSGGIDNMAFIKWLATLADARVARAIIRPGPEAREAEVEDERAKIAQILAGVKPTMRAEGENHQLRLQVMQQEAENNPDVRQHVAQKSRKGAIYLERMIHHQRMVEQYTLNAQAGRVQQSLKDPAEQGAEAPV